MSIQVGLYNMGDRSTDRLRIVFKMVYKDQCAIAEIEHADVVIVSIEKNPKKILADFKKSFPKKSVVALSNTPFKMKGIKCLTKPFKLPELLKALKQEASHNLPSEKSGSSDKKPKPSEEPMLERASEKVEDSNKAKASPKTKNAYKTTKTPDLKKPSSPSGDETYYSPNSFLQGKLATAIKQARQQNKSVFLRCWAHRWIVVSPLSDHLVENIKERQLVSMGLINTDNDFVFVSEPFSETQMKLMSETPTKEVKVTSVEKFTWNVAVRTARGRIPKGTSIDEPYILKRWPNLTRLSSISNSMRISACWLDKPLSISDVAVRLAIPLEDVFTYFSAATAIEHLKKAERRQDSADKLENAEIDRSKKGLFSAFLKKLNVLSYVSSAKSNGKDKIV